MSDAVNHIKTVLRFIDAMQANEKEGILAFFDDESVFNNIPMGAVKGAEGVWSVLGPLHETAASVEYVIHHIAQSQDGVVLTERTDRYQLEDRVAEFPVMGAFQVEGKIIRRWTDYFDMAQCLEQMPPGTELPSTD
ncbi:MAG: limonene-1,2-epoxide hydrolase family protein [bacterium]